MAPLRSDLLKAAESFCDAFADRKALEHILSFFSTSYEVSAIEHGHPDLAPFLGRTFVKISGVQQYFELIASLLSYQDIKFFQYVVDPESMKVSVTGRGSFTWISTGQSWDETFTYTLDFDDELKIVEYQVWADSGAAYLASRGELSSAKS